MHGLYILIYKVWAHSYWVHRSFDIICCVNEQRILYYRIRYNYQVSNIPYFLTFYIYNLNCKSKALLFYLMSSLFLISIPTTYNI